MQSHIVHKTCIFYSILTELKVYTVNDFLSIFFFLEYATRLDNKNMAQTHHTTTNRIKIVGKMIRSRIFANSILLLWRCNIGGHYASVYTFSAL